MPAPSTCHVHEAAILGGPDGGGGNGEIATLEEGGPNEDGDASALVAVRGSPENVVARGARGRCSLVKAYLDLGTG